MRHTPSSSSSLPHRTPTTYSIFAKQSRGENAEFLRRSPRRVYRQEEAPAGAQHPYLKLHAASWHRLDLLQVENLRPLPIGPAHITAPNSPRSISNESQSSAMSIGFEAPAFSPAQVPTSTHVGNSLTLAPLDVRSKGVRSRSDSYTPGSSSRVHPPSSTGPLGRVSVDLRRGSRQPRRLRAQRPGVRASPRGGRVWRRLPRRIRERLGRSRRAEWGERVRQRH